MMDRTRTITRVREALYAAPRPALEPIRGLTRAPARLAGVVLACACAVAWAQTPADAPKAESPEDAPASLQPADPAGDVAAPDERPIDWDFSWRGWEGLHMSASRRTRFQDPVTDLPVFDIQEVRLAGKLGLRLEVDAATFATTGNLSGFDSGVDLRRARITARGDAILAVPFNYSFDIGYVPGRFTISQAYVAVPNLPYVGTLKVGQFQPAQGLQLITSSWGIAFMEPAAPLQAIAPGSEFGVQISNTYRDGRGTWTLGVYRNNSADREYGNLSEGYGNLVGRLTWLAIDGVDRDRPASNRYLHLGLSADLQYGGNGEIRYRSRPESYIAPYVIDTGAISSNKGATYGIEVAWVDGPLSVQAEALRSTIGEQGGSTLNFAGGYVSAGWYLTGESRPYNRQTGAFRRLVPRQSFAFGPDGGWGALEVSVRASYTDLSDQNIRGGRLGMIMSSLNWYPHEYMTWMLDVGAGTVRGGASSGNLAILQTRIGLNF
jgi:phosphate-selective porin OprO/OprP